MERRQIILISALFVVLTLVGWLSFEPTAEQTAQVVTINTLTAKPQIIQEQPKKPPTNADTAIRDTAELQESSKPPYIVTCKSIEENKDVLDELDEVSADYDEFLSKIHLFSEPLKDNTDSSSQLVRGFLNENSGPKERIKLLNSVLETDPNYKLAKWDLLNVCAQDSITKIKECSGPAMENAKAIHHQNGAAWLTTLEVAYLESDNDAIVEALEQVISAPTFNDYYSEYMSLTQQVFSNSNNGKLSYEQASAISYLAIESIPPINGVLKFCKEKAVNNDYFSSLCLEAGKRISFSSKTALLRMIGFGIQKYALINLGNDSALEKLNIESEQHKYYESSLWKKAASLLEYDSELYERWLHNSINLGEIAASKMLIQETIELSKDEFYRPCDSVN